ncbi:hypothetical protein BKA80DRAFT_34800 [Phyllosticta citrichinensis]
MTAVSPNLFRRFSFTIPSTPSSSRELFCFNEESSYMMFPAHTSPQHTHSAFGRRLGLQATFAFRKGQDMIFSSSYSSPIQFLSSPLSPTPATLVSAVRSVLTRSAIENHQTRTYTRPVPVLLQQSLSKRKEKSLVSMPRRHSRFHVSCSALIIVLVSRKSRALIKFLHV